jgi:hypothetical protein
VAGIKAVDRYVEIPVMGVIRLDHIVLVFSAITVLGAEKGPQPARKQAGDNLLCPNKPAIKRGLVGKEAQTASLEPFPLALSKAVQSC